MLQVEYCIYCKKTFISYRSWEFCPKCGECLYPIENTLEFLNLDEEQRLAFIMAPG